MSDTSAENTLSVAATALGWDPTTQLLFASGYLAEQAMIGCDPEAFADASAAYLQATGMDPHLLVRLMCMQIDKAQAHPVAPSFDSYLARVVKTYKEASGRVPNESAPLRETGRFGGDNPPPAAPPGSEPMVGLPPPPKPVNTASPWSSAPAAAVPPPPPPSTVARTVELTLCLPQPVVAEIQHYMTLDKPLPDQAPGTVLIRHQLKDPQDPTVVLSFDVLNAEGGPVLDFYMMHGRRLACSVVPHRQLQSGYEFRYVRDSYVVTVTTAGG